MKIILSYFFILSIVSFGYTQNNLAQDVNPFIGTGGHGHTFPGATAPFGMVQLSPDTRIDGSWDGCSGYHYSDSLIYGFSHTHLSGTGVSDYGDFHLMPTYQNLKDYQPKDYASKFQHENEKAVAGFYSVYLEDPKIQVELTASPRVGFHRYTFDQKGTVQFIMDFTHRDEVLEAIIEPIDAQTLKLTRRSKAWAQNQYAYAYLQFDQPIKLKILRGEKNGTAFQGKNLLVAFEYKAQKGKKLQVKLAYSMTSTEGAKLNSTEISHWNFNKVVESTQKLWNKELSKIEITTKILRKKPFSIPLCIIQ